MGHVFSSKSTSTTATDPAKPTTKNDLVQEEVPSKDLESQTKKPAEYPEPAALEADPLKFQVGDVVTYTHSPKKGQHFRVAKVDEASLTAKIVNQESGGTVEGCHMELINHVPGTTIESPEDKTETDEKQVEEAKTDSKAEESKTDAKAEETTSDAKAEPPTDEVPAVPKSEEVEEASKPEKAEEECSKMSVDEQPVEQPKAIEGTPPPTRIPLQRIMNSPGGGTEPSTKEMTTKEHIQNMEKEMEELEDLQNCVSPTGPRKRKASFMDNVGSEKKQKLSDVPTA